MTAVVPAAMDPMGTSRAARQISNSSRKDGNHLGEKAGKISFNPERAISLRPVYLEWTAPPF